MENKYYNPDNLDCEWLAGGLHLHSYDFSFDRSRIRHVAGALQVNRGHGRVEDIAAMRATLLGKLSRVLSSVAQRR